MFSIEPVFINQLPPVRAHLTLRAKELRTHRMTLADVTAELALQDGKLQIDPLQAQAAGGKVDGHIGIVPAPGAPQVVLALQGKGILPGQLPQFQGKHLTGARTDLTLDITGNGRSIAEVMGNGNGHVLVRMGPGHIPNNLATADLLLDTVRLLNPLSARDRNTSIECAVFNFGVRNGLATSRRGIAVRTDQLTVLGGGVVNLKTEGIHIGVKPKAIAGTGLSLASLGGDLVHIGGTLSDPKPVANTDAQAVAGAGLKVGAAVATAGLSLLAEGLFDRATADDDVCDIALHGAARPSVTAETGTPAHQEKSVIGKATDTTRKAVRGTSETVQGALKKLFGR